MKIFAGVLCILGLIGVGWSIKKIIFYGKKTGQGHMGSFLLWMIGMFVSVVVISIGIATFIFIP